MKFITTPIVITAFLLFISCASSTNKTSGTYDPGYGYSLVWADEFDGPDINTSVWSYETEASGWSQAWNNEWQDYTDNGTGGGNAYIENGVLVIKAIMTGTVHGRDAYTSARMVTKNVKSWQYGKIAARIALPFGQGIWPAFWMLGDTEARPTSGEIDIMEMVGGASGNDNEIYGTIHWADNSKNLQSSGGCIIILDPQNYHIYEMEWTSNTIRIGVDGFVYFSKDISSGDMSEFHQTFYILLNLAVGGNWPRYPDDSTIFPQYMYIDWIRVYQQQ